ncbi:hypothetical protein EDD85DRAFT_797784 [Armillaria nabsnona]|nr:hypothetical protein EDD85DRAFT_797784 [Armillaria nabsnona]
MFSKDVPFEGTAADVAANTLLRERAPLLALDLDTLVDVSAELAAEASADIEAGISIDALLQRSVDAPTLDFSGSTWIWTGEQDGSANDLAPVAQNVRDDLYSIVVNGNQIGAGNGYKNSAVYTAGLEPEGHNVFAIAVNNTHGDAGLIATILVDYSDGTTQTIVTDTTWKTIKATPPAGVDPLGHRPFRKAIPSPYGKAAVCGKVVIAADDEYTLYVNGNNIGSSNNWASMQAYSIPVLDADENIIAVDSVNTQPTVAGLIAGVLVAYNDGTSETYYTDDSWKTLAAASPADFEATDLDDSAWISAREWMHSGSSTVPRA